MKYRFVDRYGWERWQNLAGPPPRVMKVMNERSLEPSGTFADADPRKAHAEVLLFVAQPWRYDDFHETVYVEDDRQLEDGDRFALPSHRRQQALEEKYLSLYNAVKGIVDGATKGAHPLAEMLEARGALEDIERVLATHGPLRRQGVEHEK